MSDTPPPPKPKPGSLRDRIAAFEKPSDPGKPAPPQLRPKPGGVSWKPKPPSPSADDVAFDGDANAKVVKSGSGGMSASDAKESIGRGGSLKDRMAALQGRGAFGGAPPTPAPVVGSGKKWVPPPKAAVEEEDVVIIPETKAEDASEPKVEAEGEDTAETTEEKEADPEEEERQRRAALAARMARLGGARVGVGPPVFGRPAIKKRTSEDTQSAKSADSQSVQSVKSHDTQSVTSDSETTASPSLPAPGTSTASSPILVQPTMIKESEPHDDIPRSEEPHVDAAPAHDATTSAVSSPSPGFSPALGTKAAGEETHVSKDDAAHSPSPPARQAMPVPAAPRRAAPPRKKRAPSPVPPPTAEHASSELMNNEEVAAKAGEPMSPQLDDALTLAPQPQPQHTQEEAAPTPPSAEVTPADEAQEMFTTPAEEPAAFLSRLPAAPAADEEPVPRVPMADTTPEPDAPVSDPPVVEPTQDEEEMERAQPGEMHEEEDVVKTPQTYAPLPPPPLLSPPPPPTSAGVGEGDITSAARAEFAENEEEEEQERDDEFLEVKEEQLEVEEGTETIETHAEEREEVQVEAPVSIEEEEEAARRQCVAERMARMGGLNPLGAHPSPPSRKATAPPEQEADEVQVQTEEPQSPQRELERTTAEEDDEDEEAARKRRVMERMAKMGGFNPFAAQARPIPPIRRESTQSVKSVESGSGSAPPPPPRKDSDVAAARVPEEPLEMDGTEEPEEYEDAPELQQEEEEERPRPILPPSIELRSDEEAENAYDDEMEAPPPPPPRVEYRRSIPPPPQPAELEDQTPPPPPPRVAHVGQTRRSIPPPPRNVSAPTELDEGEALPIEHRRSIPPPRHGVPVLADGVQPPPPPPRIAEHRRSIPSPPRNVPAPPVLRDGDDETMENTDELEEAPLAVPEPQHEVLETEAAQDSANEEEEMVEVPPPLPRGRHVASPPVTALEDDYEQLEAPEIGAFEHVSTPNPAPSPPSRRDRRPVPPPPPADEPEQDSYDAAEDSTKGAGMTAAQRPSAIFTDGQYRGSAGLLSPASIVLEAKRTREILDEEEGDPIDPSFHSPIRLTSAMELPAAEEAQTSEPETAAPEAEEALEAEQAVEDPEVARRRTIAERMAKLGGIRFGAAPPMPVPRARAAQSSQDEGHAPADPDAEQASQDEEEEERERKERIAAKLAGMGGMRIGMMPFAGGLPPQQSRALGGLASPPLPPARAVPPSRPPPTQAQEGDSEHESLATNSEDGVRVEAEESDEIEEIRHEDAQEEVPPPVPTRGPHRGSESSVVTAQAPSEPSRRVSRPPVPSTSPQSRRASGQSGAPSSTKSPAEAPPVPSTGQPRGASTLKSQEFVMIDSDEPPPPPPARPASRPPPPRTVPPPPAAAHAQLSDSIDSMTSSSQWELPSIPTGSLDFGGGIDTAFSVSEPVATAVQPTHPQSSQQPPAVKHTEVHYSADELVAVWGRVGVHLCEAASQLFEKSKKTLVGDGTYAGFINAALDETPNAARAAPPAWGYLVYAQSAGSVQKRLSDIMPGDIVALFDAKFKGHKGLAAYSQTVGAGEPLVGVVSEFEQKKSKIRVFQANQHVGHQTVEAASYRLEDLKSGIVKVYRVLEA